MSLPNNRRQFLQGLAASLGAASLAGCDELAKSKPFGKVLNSAEGMNQAAQQTLTTRKGLAREFTAADIAPSFRGNGSTNPQQPAYLALAANKFLDYRLQVGGLVEKPLSLSLDELRKLPAKTQITRHDCVEGWSAIGKWTGTPLSLLLDSAVVKPAARFVLFRCPDTPIDSEPDKAYYESIDLQDAYHPQTILAYDLNDQPLPTANGAPLRVRVERQLGYKMAKYIMQIELVASFAEIEGGNGGFWEDQGYQWYAGI